ncbi:hypothetical protein EN812_05720 [Mesorhizobium sp. M4B.F.Ca.ET.169.01.1.1]|nr:hypothetical protein EN812_05720 [Mesorhizobium sp. M4B.F.Ca.ET.169.01.1.1]
MTDQLSDLFRAKRGVAILATCIVQTLREADPYFESRFLDRLERTYRQLRDDTNQDRNEEMELLTWTRELLTGIALGGGPGDRLEND